MVPVRFWPRGPARNFITQKSNLLLRIWIFLSNPASPPWDCLLGCALAAWPRAVFCACIPGLGAIWASGAPKTRHPGHLRGAKWRVFSVRPEPGGRKHVLLASLGVRGDVFSRTGWGRGAENTPFFCDLQVAECRVCSFLGRGGGAWPGLRVGPGTAGGPEARKRATLAIFGVRSGVFSRPGSSWGAENTSLRPPSGWGVACFPAPAGAGVPKTRGFGPISVSGGPETRPFGHAQAAK